MSTTLVNRGAGDISSEDIDVPSGSNPTAIQRITKQSVCSPEDTDVPMGGNPAAVQRITKGPMNYVSPLTLAV